MSLIGISSTLATEGLTFNQIVTKQDGQPVIDVPKVLAQLPDDNYLRNDYTLETYGFAFPIKEKFWFSFGHSLRYHSLFKFPKELPQLLLKGNAQFIGQTIDLSNELQLTGYHVLGFGLGYEFGNFTVGGKVKFLSGFADASTSQDQHAISLYTDPDVYQLTLNSNYVLNTASAIDYRNLFDADASFGFRFSELASEPFFSGNTGMALDLGLRWENEKLDIAASVVDLGRIKWTKDATRLESTEATQYDGFDFTDAISGQGGANFEDALDTLEAALDFDKTEASYHSKLPTKAYFSLRYQLREKYSLGTVIFHEAFRGSSTTAFAVGANADLTAWLNAGLTYAIVNGNFDNVGINLTLQSNTFQVFMVTDNLSSLFDPGNSQAFSARLGSNLFF